MRTSIKLATLTSALALGVGLAATPAAADVFVTANVTKDKDVIVDIFVDKDKDVTINSTFNRQLDSAAEAIALDNQVIQGNTIERSDRAPVDGGARDVTSLEDSFLAFLIDLRATIDGSINRNIGVVGVNQDVGNANNQANVVSTAVIQQDTDGDPSFAHAEESTEQRIVDNAEEHGENLELRDLNAPPSAANLIPDKVAAIRNSINRNRGIVGVNQSAGNGVNQSNKIAVAAGIGSVLALSESDLGQTNTGNVVDEVNTVKRDVIRGSVNRNQGIVSGNQSVGAFNNQANSVAFSAIRAAATVTVPGT